MHSQWKLLRHKQHCEGFAGRTQRHTAQKSPAWVVSSLSFILSAGCPNVAQVERKALKSASKAETGDDIPLRLARNTSRGCLANLWNTKNTCLHGSMLFPIRQEQVIFPVSLFTMYEMPLSPSTIQDQHPFSIFKALRRNILEFEPFSYCLRQAAARSRCCRRRSVFLLYIFQTPHKKIRRIHFRRLHRRLVFQ